MKVALIALLLLATAVLCAADDCETLQCGSHSHCVNTDGNVECVCDAGYSPDTGGTNCVNINECEVMHGVCVYPNAVCVDTEGGFECSCASSDVPETSGQSSEMTTDRCTELNGQRVEGNQAKCLFVPSAEAASISADANFGWYGQEGKLSFTVAEYFCRGYGGNLASINSCEEEEALKRVLHDNDLTNENVWIGASDVVIEDQWLWNDGREFSIQPAWDMTTWFPQPDDAICPLCGSQDCMTVKHGGDDRVRWGDAQCVNNNRFVCQVHTNPDCDELGGVWWNGKCFVAKSQPKSWEAAQSACVTLNGRLASISSVMEEHIVRELYEQIAVAQDPNADPWFELYSEDNLETRVWIGASSDADGTYTWSDGSAMEYSRLSTEDTAHDTTCLAVAKLCSNSVRDPQFNWVGTACNHEWQANACDMEFPYVCEVPQGERGEQPTLPGMPFDLYGARVLLDEVLIPPPGGVNECNLDSHNCAVNAACIKTDGSFQCECADDSECSCNAGGLFNAELDSCEDINECDMGTDTCDANHGTCTNTMGSFECSCSRGYRLNANGHDCDDFDECVNNWAGCDRWHGRCTNLDGGYECSCNSGFTLNSNGQTCNDDNECAWDPCGPGSVCSNVPGSYTCQCMPGYKPKDNAVGCDDINECGTSPCGANSDCSNSPGSYSCQCKQGYQPKSNGVGCDDINECSNNPCNSDEACLNTGGGYSCVKGGCISGDIMVKSLRSGDKSQEAELVAVRDLIPGDQIEGMDENKQPSWCTLEAVGVIEPVGWLYGNYTWDHFVMAQDGSVQQHGEIGEKKEAELYNLITSCPVALDEVGTAFTAVDRFCGTGSAQMAWSDYILLHGAMLHLVQASGAYWFSGSTYNKQGNAAGSNATDFMTSVHGLCSSMLSCAKHPDQCEALESAADKFVSEYVNEDAQKQCKESFPALGTPGVPGSVSYTVANNKFTTPVAIASYGALALVASIIGIFVWHRRRRQNPSTPPPTAIVEAQAKEAALAITVTLVDGEAALPTPAAEARKEASQAP